jgi:hypothetical protein
MKISDLIESYRTDEASNYGRLRFRTRGHYDSLCRRLSADLGDKKIAEIKARDLIVVHQAWTASGIAMAHGLVGMLRTLCSYGAAVLENDACTALSGKMHVMRFQMAKPRTMRITAPQVVAIRRTAHAMGLHSIARAQAFQFDCMFRQRDVIGEWIPVNEPGDSDTLWHGQKWLRGIRWEEITENRVLTHTTSKRLKEVEIDLKLAGMVMAELGAVEWPTNGPVIVSEATERPYTAHEYRRLWRSVARAAGVPDSVFSMDTRAGAISEATDAGASLELVRHAATHSDVATTARYSRGATEKIAEVQRLRTAYREA